MPRWKHFLPLAAALLPGCAAPMLDVRPTHLRDLELADMDNPMIRGDQRRLLHGAIGVREQEKLLGHYYVVLWNEASGTGPVRVLFEYQQAGSGSLVKRQEQSFDAGSTEGRAEFRVIGEDYLEGGRVLAWRCRLFRDGNEIAERHSYLWE